MFLLMVVCRVYFCTCVLISALHLDELVKTCTVPDLKDDLTTQYAGCEAGSQVAKDKTCTVECKDDLVPVGKPASDTITCDPDSPWEALAYSCGTFLMLTSRGSQPQRRDHGSSYEVISGSHCPGSQESSEGPVVTCDLRLACDRSRDDAELTRVVLAKGGGVISVIVSVVGCALLRLLSGFCFCITSYPVCIMIKTVLADSCVMCLSGW